MATMTFQPPLIAATLRLASVLRSLNRVVALLCGLALLVAIALILVEIVGRRFPAIRLGGADEISGYVMAGIATWGFSYALVERAHVRIDVLHMKLPHAGRGIFDMIALASVVVVALLVAWYAFDVLAKSITRGSRSNTPLGVPLWIPQVVWFTGWVWLTLTSTVLFLCTAIFAGARRWNEVEAIAGAESGMGEAT